MLKLLQLTGVSIDDWKLQLQTNQIFNVSSRITRAMVEIALQSMQMQTCVSVLKLEQAIETRCYSEFSTIWSQFDAIGHKHSATLFNHVKTIQQLKAFDHFQLESLIGKATAQKLKDSVSKLPNFLPQLVDVRFLDKNLTNHDCKWEVKVLVRCLTKLQECRVNILAGLWNGTVSIVKRHYLLQESGPENFMTFTVTTKSGDRNMIVQLAILSTTHAGIDREIIYKCAINWADAKTPSIGRIEEINEKTLEILGRKKSECEKDCVEENQEKDALHDPQDVQAKSKPKQKLPKDQGITMSFHEPLKFTDKQLGLLPNKTLKTVAEIKKKKSEQRLELTDDENELAFEDELFKQMDNPKSTEQRRFHHDVGKEPHQTYQKHVMEARQMNEKSVHVMNQEQSIVKNWPQNMLPFSPQESTSIEFNHLLRRDQATKKDEQSIQIEQQPSYNEYRNPFAPFAYKPVQRGYEFSKHPQVLERIPTFTTLAKTSEKQANLLPRKITSENDSLVLASDTRFINQSSDKNSHFQGMHWSNAESEHEGHSIHTQHMNETKLTTPQNAGMVQVVCMHCLRFVAPKR